MSTINLWSFSPLSGWAPRGRHFRGELSGTGPLGGEHGALPGPGDVRRRGSMSRLLRLLRILARHRRRSGGR